MTAPAGSSCAVCGSADPAVFFESGPVPAHIGILWTTRESAVDCPKGVIRLAFCPSCGFVQNVSFDPSRMEYSRAYDNSLHFSPVYREYARSCALRLIERHGVRNKTVMEIGCGKGDFLALLCGLGNNEGVGFDPSFEPDRIAEAARERITFVQDFYSERHAGYQADLICCRYVLEHMPLPSSFLRTVRQSIGLRTDTVVYFEVPNVGFTLDDLYVWDVIYEHCCYFGRNSLARAFASSGFSVLEIEEVFGGQYLGIEAKPAAAAGRSDGRLDDTASIAGQVARFGSGVSRKMAVWRDLLGDWKRTGRRAVLWGAGAKGVSFLNMLRVRDEIACAVDLNPHKRSMFIPGTGHEIVAPADLPRNPPDVIVVMNPVYLEEIREQVASLGLSPEFRTP